MRFWSREIAGWALVVAGLYIFYTCFLLVVKQDHPEDRPRVVEAGLLTPIGFFLFRGGIHLLKVAVAVRVCLQAQERVREEGQRAAGARRAGLNLTLPLAGAPPSRTTRGDGG
jgi:hypothetical protein